MKLVRPALATIPHPIRAAQVRAQFWSLFARPERLDPAAADIAADVFCRTYRSRSARIAFFAALRNIYLDAPDGRRGFWTRLATLAPPALFVWGEKDRLVPAAFARHVAEGLPAVEAGRPPGLRSRPAGGTGGAHEPTHPRPHRSGGRDPPTGGVGAENPS